MAVRIAIEHPIGALPRTPFPASRDFPSRGNEKIGGTGYCVTYDTDSQSRNAVFMFIARKGDTTTLGPKGRQTYEPLGRRPIHLKNPFYTTLLHNLPAPAGHNPRRSRAPLRPKGALVSRETMEINNESKNHHFYCTGSSSCRRHRVCRGAASFVLEARL